MTAADYAIIGIIALCVFGAVKYIIRQKKSGKCIGCSQCTACKDCKKQFSGTNTAVINTQKEKSETGGVQSR